MSEIQFQGWLDKWASYAKGYRTRWFILQGEVLSYYKTKTTKEDLTTCQGSMNLINSSLVRQDMIKVKIVKEGVESFYLRSSNEAGMTRWVQEISQHLSSAVSCKTIEEHDDDEYYGILTPSLAFTTSSDHIKLKKMRNEDTSLLGQMSNGVVWCAGMGIVDLFAPGTTMLIKITGSLYPSVFAYFKEQTDIQQSLVDLKIQNALLGHALVDMKTDIEVIEDRYKQMINENTSLEDRKLEVVTVVSICKKILNCFLNKEHSFYTHPMVIAPHLIGFASLYACVAQVAIVLAPHYKDEVKEAMGSLVKCLEHYKQQVLLVRLGALSCAANSKRAKAMSYAKTAVALPVVLVNPKMAYAVDKITDKMYPCPKGGFREQIAYDRTGKYDGSGYREYRDALQAIYTTYFEDIIQQIHSLKLDTVVQEKKPDLNQNSMPYPDLIKSSSMGSETDSPRNPLPYPLESEIMPLFQTFQSQVSQESIKSNSSSGYGFVGFEKLNIN